MRPCFALLAATACSLLSAPALANPTAPAARPAAATKPATPPAAQARRPAPARPAPLPPLVLADADVEQLKAAELAHYGDYECEFGQSVHVARHPTRAGYVDVRHQNLLVTMKPVHSSTGAIRLEDVRGRLLMLQIANKSMLMDTQVGRRLVDGCMHEKHREFAANPTPTESLGIAPPKTD